MDKLEINDHEIKINGVPLQTVNGIKIYCSSQFDYDRVIISLDADVAYDCKAKIEYRREPSGGIERVRELVSRLYQQFLKPPS